MEPTGRYRFRLAWLGLARVLQQEHMGGDSFEWRDVPRASLTPARVFAILRPSEWLRLAELDKLQARVDLAERRAEVARNSRTKRSGRIEPEFEASRFAVAVEKSERKRR